MKLVLLLASVWSLAFAEPKARNAQLIHRFANEVSFTYTDLTFKFSVAYEPNEDSTAGDDKGAFGVLHITGRGKTKIERQITLTTGSAPQEFSTGNSCFRAQVKPDKANLLQLDLYKLNCAKE